MGAPACRVIPTSSSNLDVEAHFMSAKAGTNVPKSGPLAHHPLDRPLGHATYADVISAALHRDFRKTRHATKAVMRWTGASERTVKHWFAGTRGPSGEHLAMLAQHTDAVLAEFLALSGRQTVDPNGRSSKRNWLTSTDWLPGIHQPIHRTPRPTSSLSDQIQHEPSACVAPGPGRNGWRLGNGTIG